MDSSSDNEKCPDMTTNSSSKDQSLHTGSASSGILPFQPPFSHKFFDKDPESTQSRAVFLKNLIIGVLSVIMVIFLVLPIYWGALHITPNYAYRLNGVIVDFDGGSVAAAAASAMLMNRNRLGDKSISWTVHPGIDFPGGSSQIVEAIKHNKYWAGIVVNSGATLNMTQAIQTPSSSTSYNGTKAITVFVNEARNENAYRSIIRPGIETPMQAFLAEYAINNTKTIATRANANDILTNVPQIFSAPIGYDLVNILPFDVPVASAMTFVGLIYMVILTFMLTNIGAGARDGSGLTRRLTLRSMLALRLIGPIIMYFVVSLFYSLLSLAFQAPFSRHYGKAGFFLYWMLSWWAMLALGLSLEAMLTLLTPKFVAYFLITLIISNVSVTFLPIDLLPGIFKYGYAFPFYNISAGVRTILFGTRNQLGLNFGVLIAWTAVSCATISIFTWWRRKQAVEAFRNQRQRPKA